MPGSASGLTDTLVRAGAGAGKTRGLVERVVEVFQHFQARGERPRIVLTTFTRKATQELKERLILRACSARDAALLEFVSDPSRLHISTIHGLLNVFLRQVGHLAGLDAGFQILSEAEGERLARLAWREVVVSKAEASPWLETYGFERLLAMCRRFEAARHASGGLRPATLDDLERAAREEAARWKAWLKELAAEIAAGVSEPSWQAYAATLGAFLDGWDGDAAALVGLPSKPRRSKKQAEWEAWHDRVDEVIKEFKKAMGREGWERARWPEMAAAWNDFAVLAEDFVRRLSALKEKEARFEMADLEFKAIEILRAKPFLGGVFAENWDYWMIDEYQDTSPLQVACLEALIGGKPKYLVGDPQQSIYLFRGADVSVFDAAQAGIAAAGGEVRELRRNYRSEPDLLAWINDFMGSLGAGFQAMEPRESPEPPEVGGARRSCAVLMRAPDAENELRAVATRIGELLDGGATLERICVLGRTHRNLMDVSRVLKEFGFPTHVHSSRGFSGRREVIDAQALWKFLVNPHDNLNLLTVLRSPWFYVDDWRLAEWMRDRPPSLWRRLEESTDGDDDEPESLARLRLARRRLHEAGLARAFEETLCAAAYLDLSLANDPAGRKESNLWKLIHKARALEKDGGASVLDFLDGAAGTDPLDAAEGDATSAQEPGCINLMTIHGSKGLEFDHVIVPRMGESPRTSTTAPLESAGGCFFFPVWSETDGAFVASPLDLMRARHQARRELEEFDRWLYVALTRAKKSLTLTWAGRDSESWAGRSAWFLREAGRIETADYAYEIVEQWPDPHPYQAARPGEERVRAPWRSSVAAEAGERRSVTDLIDRRVDTAAVAARSGDGDLLRRWRAQTTGTRIHQALEALKYGHSPGEEAADMRAPVAYVVNLEEPPMRELIKRGHSEWGFQVSTPRGVIEGQIDLWARHDGRLYVIDYKSGSPSRKEEAFTQLEIYAWALRRFGHAEPAELVVIYPLAEKVERRPFKDESFRRWEAEFSGA
jgi:ATP-dependent helicase/nuclease subunit A